MDRTIGMNRKEREDSDSVFALFAGGFLSFMSYPFAFGCPSSKDVSDRSAELLISVRSGIGRHFANVGELISNAYVREMKETGFQE